MGEKFQENSPKMVGDQHDGSDKNVELTNLYPGSKIPPRGWLPKLECANRNPIDLSRHGNTKNGKIATGCISVETIRQTNQTFLK